MTTDPVTQTLNTTLAQDTLTPADVCDGMVACFLIINRAFVQRRTGERPIDEIDAITRGLIDDVFTDLHIDPAQPRLLDLRTAWHTLDAQLGFEAEPDLMAHHNDIVTQLFDKSAD
jgi:hypothetical protein